MTCQEVAELLMDYLAGELPSSIRSEFELHLHQCPDCVAYLKSYEQTVKLIQSMAEQRDEDSQPERPAALVNAILEARRRQQ